MTNPVIIVDSSGDIDKEYFNTPIYKVPMHIILDDKEYLDDDTLDIKDFVNEMEKSNKSSTACPTPDSWLNIAKEYDNIFLVTITSELSGTYNSALTAKTMLEDIDENKKCAVIDTKTAAGGVVLVLEKLQDLINENLPFEEIVEKINAYISSIETTFALFKVDNFVNNGRIGKALLGVINLLNISFVLEAKQGKIGLVSKARGVKKTLTNLYETILEKDYNGKKMIISYCENLDNALFIKDKLTEIYNNAEIKIVRMHALCSYYAERGGIVIGYEVQYI